MELRFGTEQHNIDVLGIAKKYFCRGDTICIPKSDVVRTNAFTDPTFGSHKSIFVTSVNGKHHSYSEWDNLCINLNTGEPIPSSFFESGGVQIQYGTSEDNIDIYDTALNYFLRYGIMHIPRSDHARTLIFSDPVYGVEKQIFISSNNSECKRYGVNDDIYLDLCTGESYSSNVPQDIMNVFLKPVYTAVIVEPRAHKALSFVLKNFLDNLSEDWHVIIFFGGNAEYLGNILRTSFSSYSHRIRTVYLHRQNLSIDDYNKMLMKDQSFYNEITTEVFLIFQTDSMIFSINRHIINEFLEFDYVGAPWKQHDGKVGNGGLSLRRKSKMLEIMHVDQEKTNQNMNEDIFFAMTETVKLNKPTCEKAKHFSTETIFFLGSFGCHKPWGYWNKNELDATMNIYSEFATLVELNK